MPTGEKKISSYPPRIHSPQPSKSSADKSSSFIFPQPNNKPRPSAAMQSSQPLPGAVLLAPSPAGTKYDMMYYLKGAAAGGICCSITHGALCPGKFSTAGLVPIAAWSLSPLTIFILSSSLALINQSFLWGLVMKFICCYQHSLQIIQ